MNWSNDKIIEEDVNSISNTITMNKIWLDYYKEKNCYDNIRGYYHSLSCSLCANR